MNQYKRRAIFIERFKIMNSIYLDTFMGQILITKKGERILVEVVSELKDDNPDQYLKELKAKIVQNPGSMDKFLIRLIKKELFIQQIKNFKNGKVNWLKIPKQTNWNEVINFCERLSTYQVDGNNIIYSYKNTLIQITYCNGNLYIAYNNKLNENEIIKHIKTKFNFSFEDNAIDQYFKKTIFKELIRKYYPVDEVYFDSLDECLVWAIISQLISTKAATTIYKRFIALFNNGQPIQIFPERNAILKLSDQKFIDGGISIKKVKIIKNILTYFTENNISKKTLQQKTENEIRNELIALKGVGPWTINLILLFLLKKENVFLPKDVGIQEGLKNYLGLTKRPNEKEALNLVETIDKYRSYLCISLWKIKRYKEKNKTSNN